MKTPSPGEPIVNPARLPVPIMAAWMREVSRELNLLPMITVSATEPPNPQVNDIWIDIS